MNILRKSIVVLAVCGVVAPIFMSCEGTGKSDRESDSTAVEEHSAISPEMGGISGVKGVVGDGTSMNVLEFIKADGDTLYIAIPNTLVMGGLEAGDEIDVIYSENADGDLLSSVAINLTALQHVWTQTDMNGNAKSLEIDPNGVATTYGMTVEYDKWALKDGRLLLHSPAKLASEQGELTDTFQIMELTDERLILMNGNFETVFEREN